MSIAAATTGAVVLALVEQVLLPALRGRPDVVVRGDGQSGCPQGRAGPPCLRGGQRRVPLPAVLLTRPEPDRALLVQAQGRAAGQGGTDAGSTRGRARPGPGHDHRPGCQGLVPALGLRASQLTCRWL